MHMELEGGAVLHEFAADLEATSRQLLKLQRVTQSGEGLRVEIGFQGLAVRVHIARYLRQEESVEREDVVEGSISKQQRHEVVLKERHILLDGAKPPAVGVRPVGLTIDIRLRFKERNQDLHRQLPQVGTCQRRLLYLFKQELIKLHRLIALLTQRLKDGPDTIVCLQESLSGKLLRALLETLQISEDILNVSFDSDTVVHHLQLRSRIRSNPFSTGL